MKNILLISVLATILFSCKKSTGSSLNNSNISGKTIVTYEVSGTGYSFLQINLNSQKSYTATRDTVLLDTVYNGNPISLFAQAGALTQQNLTLNLSMLINNQVVNTKSIQSSSPGFSIQTTIYYQLPQ